MVTCALCSLISSTPPKPPSAINMPAAPLDSGNRRMAASARQPKRNGARRLRRLTARNCEALYPNSAHLLTTDIEAAQTPRSATLQQRRAFVHCLSIARIELQSVNEFGISISCDLYLILFI